MYVQFECLPKEQVENMTFVMKVLVGPIQSVWNCGRHGLLQEGEIAVDMACFKKVKLR
jgi:hypothetical protein